MNTLWLELYLEADLVQTARPQTMGVHESLEYVRGATLYGAAAASLYGAVGERAYDLFHSGRVRFCDAVPVFEGQPSVPVPLGWFVPKNDGLVCGRPVAPGQVAVGHHTPPDEFVRRSLVQVRGGYVTPDGVYRTLGKSYGLKTAVDRTRRGAAREGQLYGYEALPAGSTWLARIDADDPADLRLVAGWLGDTQTLWLGRSRGAEYGRTRVRLTDGPPGGRAPVADPQGRVVVHLLSDLALTASRTGEPSLTPEPDHFGLGGGWRFDPEGSSVGVRSYSPYNGKRRSHDLDRRVLARGSVLVFAGGEVDLRGLADRLRRGVGGHRQEGLGQVALNPWYLAQQEPAFGDGAVEKSVPTPRPAPKPELAAWLERRATLAEMEVDSVEQAEDWAAQWWRLRRKENVWPTRSQWNKVASLARACLGSEAPETLLRRLDQEVLERASGGMGANQWPDWLKEKIRETVGGGGDRVAYALYHAARRLRAMKKEGS